MATAGQSPKPFRKRLFGYDREEVERALAELEAERQVMQAELERLRNAPDVSPEVAGHLAALLQSFAETVTEGQREADARAAQIVADAEERAAHLEANALKLLDQANEMVATSHAEAQRRQDEAIAARELASARIGEAVDRLAGALAILDRAPDGSPATAATPSGEPPAAAGTGATSAVDEGPGPAAGAVTGPADDPGGSAPPAVEPPGASSAGPGWRRPGGGAAPSPPGGEVGGAATARMTPSPTGADPNGPDAGASYLSVVRPDPAA
ncbi:MAG: hypothetical protein AB7H43_01740 [Acidimicrobiia bacterium]